MTDQEINCAIAEWRGWKQCDPEKSETADLFHLKGRGFSLRKDLPDYVNDLNSVHESEMRLSGHKDDEHSELAEYQEQLCLVCGDGMEPLNVYDIDLIRASARQRCEALCRTIGKWKE